MLRRLMVLLVAVALTGCSSAGTSSGDAQGARQAVVAYMDALKAQDYLKALQLAGVQVPGTVAPQVNQALQSRPEFTWKVTAYEIKDVQVDGGLAKVTVEETSTRDVPAEAKAALAAMGEAATGIKWGEIKVTETFILVKPAGSWEFDPVHSGIPAAKIPIEALAESATRREPPSAETQKALVDLANNTGLGQLTQSLAASGPIVPIIAAIAVPNFVRAREVGQLTGCKSNLKNIGTALEMWSTDNSGRYPGSLSDVAPNYLKSIPTCPVAGRDTYSEGFESASDPDAYTVICTGENHNEVPENYPQYTSTMGLIEK